MNSIRARSVQQPRTCELISSNSHGLEHEKSTLLAKNMDTNVLVDTSDVLMRPPNTSARYKANVTDRNTGMFIATVKMVRCFARRNSDECA